MTKKSFEKVYNDLDSQSCHLLFLGQCGTVEVEKTSYEKVYTHLESINPQNVPPTCTDQLKVTTDFDFEKSQKVCHNDLESAVLPNVTYTTELDLLASSQFSGNLSHLNLLGQEVFSSTPYPNKMVKNLTLGKSRELFSQTSRESNQSNSSTHDTVS